MKFSTREDIDAPIDHVFAKVSDFAGFERRALRQGAQIKRLDDGPAQIGSIWEAALKFRGRERRIQATLSALQPPETYRVHTLSDGLTAETQLELIALSPTRTRVILMIDLRARTLTARLLLQSMKLAKGKLTKRFKARVLEFAEDIEDAYRKGAQG
ncbi:SRPBCC family protein [Yoonia sp.]|uniref:SRPBCC family protein n=1 Tax=Yoonia sp. TaxID=2212373 RepID=UPI0025ED4E52|nr:SRPBCC family protein [Yoonia sp.]